MSELLKCPFCGGELKKNVWGSLTDNNEDCIMYGFEIHPKLIPKWNTRKPLERIVERLEEKSFWLEPSFDEEGYCEDDSEEVVFLSDAIEIIKEEGQI